MSEGFLPSVPRRPSQPRRIREGRAYRDGLTGVAWDKVCECRAGATVGAIRFTQEGWCVHFEAYPGPSCDGCGKAWTPAPEGR